MQKTILLAVGAIGTMLSLALIAGAPLAGAIAHEADQMECTEASVNAMQADIQAMSDGPSKTAAMKELQTSQQMMTKKDVKGCMEHLHSAMQAMEK